MKKGELIYLASPYSKGDRDSNFKIVTEKASELVALGYTVISPITYGHTLLEFKDMPIDWKFWMKFCSQLLYKCDRLVVYMMPGWENSKGVLEEISIAIDHDIPVEYLDYRETCEETCYETATVEKTPKWDL